MMIEVPSLLLYSPGMTETLLTGNLSLNSINQSTFVLSSCLQMEFVDNDTQDIFSTDLNSWVAVDHKLDGWKEFPIPWPAILIPKGLLIPFHAIHIKGCLLSLLLMFFGGLYCKKIWIEIRLLPYSMACYTYS